MVLAVLPGLVATLEFDEVRMRAAAQDPALGATDLAEHLVREKAIPFRRAHEIVGALVRHAETKGVSLRAIPAAELAGIAPELDEAALASLDPERAVAARTLPGGPAPSAVLARVEALGSRAARARLRDQLRGVDYSNLSASMGCRRDALSAG